MRAIEIFRPGRHTAMSGQALEFSEADLQASADAYDPALHEAPIVVGHPRHDAPAYGWVGSLRYAEGLEADPRAVDPDFAEMVRAERFKKVSASFYHPSAEANPKPGVYYLRHLGFLGAQPPAVKGLRQAEFADADADVVTLEFGEANGSVIQEAFRRLREWIIGTQGKEAADEALPGWLVDESERESPSYSEPRKEIPDVEKAELERREAALKKREEQIQTQETSFAEREAAVAKAEAERRKGEHRARVDKLVEAGRVLPRDRDGLVEFLEAQSAEAVVEFGEGAEAVKKGAKTWFLEFLEHLPKAVDYQERGAPESGPAKAPASVEVAEGFYLDPQTAALHRKALEYAEAHKTDIATAVRAVEQQEA